MLQQRTEIPNTTLGQIGKSLESWQGIGVKILNALFLRLVSTEEIIEMSVLFNFQKRILLVYLIKILSSATLKNNCIDSTSIRVFCWMCPPLLVVTPTA